MTRRKGSTETSRFNREQLWCGSAEMVWGPAEPRRRWGARRLLGAVLGRLGAPMPDRRGQAEGIAVV